MYLTRIEFSVGVLRDDVVNNKENLLDSDLNRQGEDICISVENERSKISQGNWKSL